MKRSIDISIGKSFERLKDFENDSSVGKEIIETLSVLHTLGKVLDEFQENNKHLFIDNKQ
jgi:CRISPR/Cas system-associated endonuclease Cas3-HD